jgi:large subunit ribosomal protein L6
MSKIGQKSILLSDKVTANISGQNITIKGPEGELSFYLPKTLIIEKKDKELVLKRTNDDKKTKSLHGLYRQLIYNAVVGVEKLWEKRLEIIGTGYNVKLQGEDLVFKLGYSHPVVFKKPAGVKFRVEGNNKVIVMGADKQLVGEVAYQIKILKKPDVYKGKGIRYEGEKLRIKPGKKVKTTTGA